MLHEIGFWRGVTLSWLAFGLVILALLPAAQHFHERRAVDMEANRLSGYSLCCMDMMDIVYHGGGVDELIMFAKAKGETCFSPMVNATNFYGGK